ncbi:Uncharacterised protein [Salmonella enterica subsp. enterica]|uniref:Uncharacterized protein n=1 Tax=Salmonella enterica I TaxID=59201 RepID=A0A447MTX4_SALET|nr:Uncharacterised protein [Salmonella enterica subsp. enterica]
MKNFFKIITDFIADISLDLFCYIFMHVIRIQNRTINWCDIIFYCINYLYHSSFCFLLIS